MANKNFCHERGSNLEPLADNQCYDPVTATSMHRYNLLVGKINIQLSLLVIVGT